MVNTKVKPEISFWCETQRSSSGVNSPTVVLVCTRWQSEGSYSTLRGVRTRVISSCVGVVCVHERCPCFYFWLTVSYCFQTTGISVTGHNLIIIIAAPLISCRVVRRRHYRPWIKSRFKLPGRQWESNPQSSEQLWPMTIKIGTCNKTAGHRDDRLTM